MESIVLTRDQLAGLMMLAAAQNVDTSGTQYVLRFGDGQVLIDTEAMTISAG